MLRGSCLCGGVRWEVDRFEAMSNCHCSMCRKAHGAAYATFGQARAACFRFTAGEDLVRRFRSTPEVERTFCSVCGSNLTFLFDPLPKQIWVAAGTCDDDPGMRPQRHIFVASKAPWHEITDDLPQSDEYGG